MPVHLLSAQWKHPVALALSLYIRQDGIAMEMTMAVMELLLAK
jgi:hypothetical protein